MTNNDLKITDTVMGTGKEATKGALLFVQYEGFLENGTKFDSSYDHGRPAQFVIGSGRVIKGWDQGLMGMKEGRQAHSVYSVSFGLQRTSKRPDSTPFQSDFSRSCLKFVLVNKIRNVDYKKVFFNSSAPLCLFVWWEHRPVAQPEGVLVPETPQQISIPDAERKPVVINDQVIEPLASYKIRARVLSKERYWMDPGSKISPIDLALGWGPMSDSRVIEDLSISQGQLFTSCTGEAL